MRARIQKWGNSLAVRIPKALAAMARLGQDSEIEMRLEEDRIVLEPLAPRKYSLSKLLESITPDNIHAFAATGSSVGKESW